MAKETKVVKEKDNKKFDFKQWAEAAQQRRQERRSLHIDRKAPVISVRNLKVFFKHGVGRNKLVVKAINDVSFDIHKGEVFGLVGESGCGKTTTGRTIIKLHTPTDGEIFFLGNRIGAGVQGLKDEIKAIKKATKEKVKELKAVENPDQEEIMKLNHESREKIHELKHEIRVRNGLIEENYELMKKMQMIFQDPIESLNPRMTVKEIVAEGLRIAGFKELIEDNNLFVRNIKDEISMLKSKLSTSSNPDEIKAKIATLKQRIKEEAPFNKIKAEIRENPEYKKLFLTRKDVIEHHINHKVNDVLETVGLLPEHASRYPHEFSGGQRQRIGVARAIINAPEFIIADEPISALDVSIQAQVINLLNDLRDNFGITIMFIAHDLSVIKYFSDRIGVMYYGNLVELADADELFLNPLHPYTRSLLSAVPLPDPHYEKQRKRIRYNPATEHDYSVEQPKLQEVKKGHWVLANSKEIAEYKKGLK